MKREVKMRRKNRLALVGMVAVGMVYVSFAVMISLDVPYMTLLDNAIATAKLAL